MLLFAFGVWCLLYWFVDCYSFGFADFAWLLLFLRTNFGLDLSLWFAGVVLDFGV